MDQPTSSSNNSTTITSSTSHSSLPTISSLLQDIARMRDTDAHVHSSNFNSQSHSQSEQSTATKDTSTPISPTYKTLHKALQISTSLRTPTTTAPTDNHSLDALIFQFAETNNGLEELYNVLGELDSDVEVVRRRVGEIVQKAALAAL